MGLNKMDKPFSPLYALCEQLNLFAVDQFGNPE